jgi:purine nucleoside permease
MDAATSLSNQRIGAYGAYLPSLEAAYSVGHAVVSELIKNWELYHESPPNAGKP